MATESDLSAFLRGSLTNPTATCGVLEKEFETCPRGLMTALGAIIASADTTDPDDPEWNVKDAVCQQAAIQFRRFLMVQAKTTAKDVVGFVQDLECGRQAFLAAFGHRRPGSLAGRAACFGLVEVLVLEWTATLRCDDWALLLAQFVRQVVADVEPRKCAAFRFLETLLFDQERLPESLANALFCMVVEAVPAGTAPVAVWATVLHWLVQGMHHLHFGAMKDAAAPLSVRALSVLVPMLSPEFWEVTADVLGAIECLLGATVQVLKTVMSMDEFVGSISAQVAGIVLGTGSSVTARSAALGLLATMWNIVSEDNKVTLGMQLMPVFVKGFANDDDSDEEDGDGDGDCDGDGDGDYAVHPGHVALYWLEQWLGSCAGAAGVKALFEVCVGLLAAREMSLNACARIGELMTGRCCLEEPRSLVDLAHFFAQCAAGGSSDGSSDGPNMGQCRAWKVACVLALDADMDVAAVFELCSGVQAAAQALHTIPCIPLLVKAMLALMQCLEGRADDRGKATQAVLWTLVCALLRRCSKSDGALASIMFDLCHFPQHVKMSTGMVTAVMEALCETWFLRPFFTEANFASNTVVSNFVCLTATLVARAKEAGDVAMGFAVRGLEALPRMDDVNAARVFKAALDLLSHLVRCLCVTDHHLRQAVQATMAGFAWMCKFVTDKASTDAPPCVYVVEEVLVETVCALAGHWDKLTSDEQDHVVVVVHRLLSSRTLCLTNLSGLVAVACCIPSKGRFPAGFGLGLVRTIVAKVQEEDQAKEVVQLGMACLAFVLASFVEEVPDILVHHGATFLGTWDPACVLKGPAECMIGYVCVCVFCPCPCHPSWGKLNSLFLVCMCSVPQNSRLHGFDECIVKVVGTSACRVSDSHRGVQGISRVSVGHWSTRFGRCGNGFLGGGRVLWGRGGRRGRRGGRGRGRGRGSVFKACICV